MARDGVYGTSKCVRAHRRQPQGQTSPQAGTEELTRTAPLIVHTAITEGGVRERTVFAAAYVPFERDFGFLPVSFGRAALQRGWQRRAPNSARRRP
jgi:hypothetical protein